jgi:isopenicillin-N epimerase
MANTLSTLWGLDPNVTFLNHGSFGATPLAVLRHQMELRQRLEAEPVRFMMREMEPLYQESLATLAFLIGAQSQDLVFVPNVTHGVNAVMRSLPLQPGDEILTTNQDYYAVRNTLELVARRSGARVVVADIPFPLTDESQVVQAIKDKISPATRIALIDHVTSPTALIFPVEKIVQVFTERGIDTLIDGAHAPGMVPLAVESLGAAYYTGNCHKWLCAPKGAGFLWVRRDKQELIHAPISSYTRSSPYRLSPFQLEFYWSGTLDPTAYLSVGYAIQYMASLLEQGWPAIMQRNRDLIIKARQSYCRILGQPAPCPEHMLGSMASVPLPAHNVSLPLPAFYIDELQEKLIAQFGVQVPVMMWPRPPHRLLRFSAQLYNTLAQYELLTEAITKLAYAA